MLEATGLSLVQHAIRNSKVLTLKTCLYDHRERSYVDKIIRFYAKHFGIERCADQLSYCIHELASNAKRANTKRIYFEEKGLSLQTPAEYYIGMRGLKAESPDNILFVLQRQKEKGLFIKLQFYNSKNALKLVVRNNCELSELERKRIKEKLRLGRSLSSISKAYTVLYDFTEGAGLGIVMLILMLNDMGFGKEALNIFSRRGETYSVITLTK
jgi:hypothetical protein